MQRRTVDGRTFDFHDGGLAMHRLSDEEPDDDIGEEEFLDPTLTSIHPESDVDEHGYVHGWSGIASERRHQVDHRCQACGIRLKEKPHLLHVHHLDRDKTNNESKNLQVLCVVCHAKADGHTHLLARALPSDIAYIGDLQAKRARES